MMALKKPIIVENSDNDALQEWFAKNLDLIHLVESSGNKLLSIPGPIPTSSTATNQVGFVSIGFNNANVSRSGRENTIAGDCTIGNKGTEKSYRDAKVGLEV